MYSDTRIKGFETTKGGVGQFDFSYIMIAAIVRHIILGIHCN